MTATSVRTAPDRPPTSKPAPTVFAADDQVLLGHGAVRHIYAARRDDPGLPDRLRAALADTGGIAVGTLGFAPDDPASFVVPERVERLDRATAIDRLAADPLDVRVTERHEPCTEPDLAAAVEEALARIVTDPQLRKVVLGRWLHLRTDPAVAPIDLLARLLASRRHPYVFAVRTGTDTPTRIVHDAPIRTLDDSSIRTASGDAPVLVGASPELLVARRGRTVRSTPLAGSAARSDDPDEDRRRSQRLAASHKDHHEHALVVEAIEDALAPWCDRLRVDPSPRLVSTDTLWHLATEVEGHLHADDPPDAVALARRLHPTPAVCGTPTAAAHRSIAELEPTPRGVMTGAVGWMDAAGDGEFAVTIRSALLDGPWVRMFAGAGVVAGSDPVCEARETTAKLGTMLGAVMAP